MKKFVAGLKSKKTAIIAGIIAVFQILKFTGIGDKWFSDIDETQVTEGVNTGFDSLMDFLSWIGAAIGFFFSRDADKTSEESGA